MRAGACERRAIGGVGRRIARDEQGAEQVPKSPAKGGVVDMRSLGGGAELNKTIPQSLERTLDASCILRTVGASCACISETVAPGNRGGHDGI